MRYENFAKRVRLEGLEPRQCTYDHWQIRGGTRNPIVNFWPHAEGGPKVCVQGAAKSRTGNLQYAINLAGSVRQKAKELGFAPGEDAVPERVGLIRWLWRLIW